MGKMERTTLLRAEVNESLHKLDDAFDRALTTTSPCNGSREHRNEID